MAEERQYAAIAVGGLLSMTLSAGVLTLRVAMRPWYQIPSLEAFPVSLSVVRLAGLEDHLDKETTAKLRDIEDQLLKEVRLAPMLRARTEDDLRRAFSHGFDVAVHYYVQSGIIIWRALNHDYTKLLRLSEVSSEAVEQQFFRYSELLDRDTLIKAVAGLRVLRKVGEGIILVEKEPPPDRQALPVDYLSQIVVATFITWCFLSYLQEPIRQARRANLRLLAEGILSVANDAYREARQRKLYATETEATYWSPAWQEGEAEADLDIHHGAVKSFSSVEELLEDLHA